MWHAYLVYFFNLGTSWPFDPCELPPTAKIITTLLWFLLDLVHFFLRIAHVVFSRCSHHLRIHNWNIFLPMTCWSAERTRLSIATFQAHQKKTNQECEGNILIDGRNPAPVGRWFLRFSLYLQGFSTIPGGMVWDFWTISTEGLNRKSHQHERWKRQHRQQEPGISGLRSPVYPGGWTCGCCWSLEKSYKQKHVEISWCNTCIATNQIEILNSNFQLLLIDGQNPALNTVYCVNISKISDEITHVSAIPSCSANNCCSHCMIELDPFHELKGHF